MADTLDQSEETGLGYQSVGSSTADVYAAQGVTLAQSGRLTKFGFQLKLAAADPSWTLTGYLFADDSGKPGTLLATYSTVATSTLSGSDSWAYFSLALAAAPVVAASTVYHIAFKTSGNHGTNYVQAKATGSSTYAGGVYNIGDTTPAWTSVAASDLNFKQYYDPSALPQGAFLLHFV
jgi:hypothetical protein